LSLFTQGARPPEWRPRTGPPIPRISVNKRPSKSVMGVLRVLGQTLRVFPPRAPSPPTCPPFHHVGWLETRGSAPRLRRPLIIIWRRPTGVTMLLVALWATRPGSYRPVPSLTGGERAGCTRWTARAGSPGGARTRPCSGRPRTGGPGYQGLAPPCLPAGCSPMRSCRRPGYRAIRGPRRSVPCLTAGSLFPVPRPASFHRSPGARTPGGSLPRPPLAPSR